MTSIKVNPIQNRQSLWTLARGYAGIIDSRESTYRTYLDITGYCVPMVMASAFRNIYNFAETLFETGFDVFAVYIAPKLTRLSGAVVSKFILPKTEQKDYLNYLNFGLRELESKDSFLDGVDRIKKEESSDRKRIGELYRNLGNEEKANSYFQSGDEIHDFADELKHSDELRNKIYKLKRATIVSESFLEGILFASEGLLTRGFRKYILRQDQFTGTLGYSSDTTGNFGGEGLSTFQKIGVGLSFISAPVLNLFLFQKTKDLDKVKENKSLQKINSEIDMTHGVFPKLWLLFTYLMVPFWMGKLFTAQDKFELFETVFKQALLTPSWWFGHRATNGVLAKHSDKVLKNAGKEYGVFVEKSDHDFSENLTMLDKLKKLCPEPTRIQHIIDKTKHDPKLLEDSTNTHAKNLYGGFTMHSIGIWLLMMFGNWVTKKWVISEK